MHSPRIAALTLFGSATLLAALALACGSSTPECTAPEVACGMECVNTATNVYNCGECDKTCGPGQICQAGTCKQYCPAEQTVCGSTCKDLKNDPSNCGGCDQKCPFGQTCVSGTCATSCPAPTLACDGKCVDPNTDPNYCGAISDCIGLHHGAVCQAGQVCSSGVCAANCSTGLENCSGTCRDTQHNPDFCGSCTTACPAVQNATRACVTATCSFVCNPGFADCDNNASTGCEAVLASDKNNCGKCGNVCAGACASGQCQ